VIENKPAVQHRTAELSRPIMISIVDDDECAREAIEGLVRSLGHMVATYVSAEDFLDSHQFYNTSCLITDVHLPGLTGVELYRRLLADGFAAPTIFVTGLPTSRRVCRCWLPEERVS
jgi:FixJ family two-component response regulator